MNEPAVAREAPASLEGVPLWQLRQRLDMARVMLGAKSIEFRRNAMREHDQCVAEFKRRGYAIPR